MILKSRKVALYFGMALVLMLVPILPATITASTMNQIEETSTNAETNEKAASYVAVAKYLVANNQYQNINTERCLFYGKAVATTAPYVEVKSLPDDTSEIVGKLLQYNIADVIEQNDQWTKISSGNLIGYVKTSLLCFDEEAQAVARIETNVSATVTEDDTSIYSSSSDDAQVIKSISSGTKVTPVKFVGDFVVIQLEDNSLGYIINKSVSVNYGFQNGLTNAEEEAKIAEAAAKAKAEEEAKAAEEARIKAEQAEKARQEALKQQIIQRTKDGSEFTYNPTMQVSDDEIWLMACIIDWESGWESYEGKLAVANIILNRVRSPRYPNTVTGVVYARSQFSGVLDSSGNISARFGERLAAGPRTQDCIKAALEALSGKNNVGHFTAFISTGSANYSSYPDYMIIGNHCFY